MSIILRQRGPTFTQRTVLDTGAPLAPETDWILGSNADLFYSHINKGGLINAGPMLTLSPLVVIAPPGPLRLRQGWAEVVVGA